MMNGHCNHEDDCKEQIVHDGLILRAICAECDMSTVLAEVQEQ